MQAGRPAWARAELFYTCWYPLMTCGNVVSTTSSCVHTQRAREVRDISLLCRARLSRTRSHRRTVRGGPSVCGKRATDAHGRLATTQPQRRAHTFW